MVEPGSKDRLLKIADEIEGLPKVIAAQWPGEVGNAAGRLFDEALRLGAFSGDEHLRLRLLVARQHTNYPDRFDGIWDEAVACLCAKIAAAHGSVNAWVDACPVIANAIRADAATPPAARTEQGEGKGGAGSAPGQPAVVSVPDKKAVFRQLKPAVRKAYLAFQYAETTIEKTLQDREAYDWLHENGIDQGKGDLGELTGYELPDSFETFKRYLSDARTSLGENKHTRRGRRVGRSIARKNEIE